MGGYLDTIARLIQRRRDPAFVWWRLRYARELNRFSNIHHGEDCFILGNGPSLNKIDLERLNDYHSFGLNKIFMLFGRSTFRPTYHVAVNQLVIEQSAREIEELPCHTFLSYRHARHLIKKLEHIHYLYTGGPVMFCSEPTDEVNEGYTVTFVAMELAYFMGFKNVFLVGVDHNFVAQGAPNERQLLSGEDPNHFDRGYFAGKKWDLPDLEASELSYRMAKFHFVRRGRNIYDATPGGKLQVFPKVSFEDALLLCRRKR